MIVLYKVLFRLKYISGILNHTSSYELQIRITNTNNKYE